MNVYTESLHTEGNLQAAGTVDAECTIIFSRARSSVNEISFRPRQVCVWSYASISAINLRFDRQASGRTRAGARQFIRRGAVGARSRFRFLKVYLCAPGRCVEARLLREDDGASVVVLAARCRASQARSSTCPGLKHPGPHHPRVPVRLLLNRILGRPSRILEQPRHLFALRAQCGGQGRVRVRRHIRRGRRGWSIWGDVASRASPRPPPRTLLRCCSPPRSAVGGKAIAGRAGSGVSSGREAADASRATLTGQKP